MNFAMPTSEWFGIATHLVVLAVGAGFILAAAALEGFAKRPWPAAVSGLGLVAASFVLLFFIKPYIYTQQLPMRALFVNDGYARFFHVMTLLIALLGCVALWLGDMRNRGLAGTHTALLLFMCTAVSLQATSADLIIMVVSGETVLAMYYVFAAASSREQEGCSGSLVGLVKVGVLTSVLTILGAAFLFGTVGSTDLWEIAGRLQEVLYAERGAVPMTAKAGYVVALGLLFSGMLLRMEAFPFHGWTCRIHASIRTPFASFLSAGMKIAAFAVTLRILWIFFIRHSREYEENFSLIAIISTVAVLTVLAGTWKAFLEKDFRKFMACSSVAHTGFLLMGVSLCSRQGIEPVMVYLGIYAVMTFGAFFIFGAARGRSPRAGIDVLNGLHRRSPVLAGSMTVILMSLIGIPVTGGFMAKYFLFKALLGHSKSLFHIVAAIGIAASVLSAVYYGRVIHAMYFKPGPETREVASGTERAPAAAAIIALMLAALLIVTGVYWKPLQQAAVSAMMIIEFQY